MYNRLNPSTRYNELTRLYQQLHKDGQQDYGIPPNETFPGSAVFEHIVRIKQMIQFFNAKSLLDYGSGKGMQYLVRNYTVPGMDLTIPSLQDFWQIDAITCYDPCFPPFAVLPQNKFDAVISTDMLEHCPEEDVDWIVDELFQHANRFVFASIASYPAQKTLPNGENAHCTLKPVEWWKQKFDNASARSNGVKYKFTFTYKENSSGREKKQTLIVKNYN